MKIAVLSSGSKGNATIINSGDTFLLVDDGLSTKLLASLLNNFDIGISQISGILVTHSHIDHFKGLEGLCKKVNIPLFASEETASSIDLCVRKTSKGKTLPFCWNYIAPGNEFIFNNLLITPFEVPHDANGAVAYIIKENNVKLGIATDLGCITNSVKFNLQGCDALVLEMNHDPRMLQESDRQQYLKNRISSKLGHLSNYQAVEFLESIDTTNLKYLFPAHLSEECNDFSCVMSALLSMEKKKGFEVVRTYQNASSQMVEIL